MNEKQIKVITTLGKVAGLATAASSYINMLPPKYIWVGSAIVLVSSVAKDVLAFLNGIWDNAPTGSATASKTSLVALLFCLCVFPASAQNVFQQGFDAAVTNGAVGAGVWRSTSGNYNIASYDYIYGFNTETNSLGAGLIVGGDYMWSGKSNHVQNDVKGGFSVNYHGTLEAIGFTNANFGIDGGNCIATPRSSSVGIGDITFVNLDVSFAVYHNIRIHFAPGYQKRFGQGQWDRTYLGVQLFLGGKF